MKHSHPYHSLARRAGYSFLLIVAIVAVGMMGMRRFEGMSSLDAFYFMCMIATAQGPSTVPVTAAGKIFAAMMAFISVGSVLAALGFLFGPFFARFWHVSVKKIKEEERELLKLRRRR